MRGRFVSEISAGPARSGDRDALLLARHVTRAVFRSFAETSSDQQVLGTLTRGRSDTPAARSRAITFSRAVRLETRRLNAWKTIPTLSRRCFKASAKRHQHRDVDIVKRLSRTGRRCRRGRTRGRLPQPLGQARSPAFGAASGLPNR